MTNLKLTKRPRRPTLRPMPDLRYPIGQYEAPEIITPEHIAAWIHTLEATPERLRAAIDGLNDEQLATPYRPDGWTVRQVVHHLPDSHVNAYCRCKLAVTEDHPTIRPYDEVAWANLHDGLTGPLDLSLSLLTALHARWVLFLRSLQPSDFERTLYHPAADATWTLGWLVGQYAWHSEHHVAHITTLRERMGW